MERAMGIEPTSERWEAIQRNGPPSDLVRNTHVTNTRDRSWQVARRYSKSVGIEELRKAGAPPRTNRTFMDEVEALGVSFEREADSPVCWKQ